MEAELLNQHSGFLLCGTASPRVPLGSDAGTHWLLSLMQKCRCWQGAEVTTSVFTFSEIALRHGDYSGSSRQEFTGWFCLVSAVYLEMLG